MNLPEPLPESSDLKHRSLYNWLNRLRDYCLSTTLQVSGGGKLIRGPSGTIYQVGKASGGGGGGSIQLTVTLETSNTLICSTGQLVAKPPMMRGFVSGTTIQSFPITFTGGGGTGGAAIAIVSAGVVIAIIPLLGGSGYATTPTAVFTAGGGISATATVTVIAGVITNVVLTAGGTGYITYVIDNQFIYPPYNPGTIIYAVTPTGGTGVSSVTLQDVTPGRVLMTQLRSCENLGGTATTLWRMFACSPPQSVAL